MSFKINYSAEEKIKLAKDDSIDKLYESKKNQRTVRVLTVCAYVLTVSMAAIVLSAYYVFLWNPQDLSAKNPQNPNAKCGQLQSKITVKHQLTCILSFLEKVPKIIVPENIAIRLANSSEVSLESFYEDIIKELQKFQIEARRSYPKMNRNDFNEFLKRKSIQIQNDSPVVRKKISKKKKYQDDEDFNIDMESSGDKIVTTAFPTPTADPSSDLNDTTIIFDQEQED